jgi:hypothetical protein
MCGKIKIILGGKTRKGKQLKLYKPVALPCLMYRSETWTLRKSDKERLEAEERLFLRHVERKEDIK